MLTFFHVFVCACLCAAVAREALTAVIGNQTHNSTVVLVGSSAGGIGAFNVVSWLLDSFQQVLLGKREMSLIPGWGHCSILQCVAFM